MSIYGGGLERPTAELISFVSAVYEDVDWVLEMRYPLSAPEVALADQSLDDLYRFLARLADAWPSVLGTREDLIERISDLPNEVLVAYGLAGLELQVKLIAWQGARQRLRQVVVDEGTFAEAPDVSVEESLLTAQRRLPGAERFRRVKRVLKWTSRVLGHADTVLGSLAALVNQAERLKEIKETVEKVTGEVAEDLAE